MYDAIVVGARCAGSPLAMLLARKGWKVLLVDRERFPSDMPMSTHLVHPRGIALLAKWGLLRAMESIPCRPYRAARLDFGPIVLQATPPAVDGIAVGYGPRRHALDALLIEAAEAAGAELRTGFEVESLVFDDGRVTGIRGRAGSGAPVEERARFVIGADGPGSRVAHAVGAGEYEPRPALQGTIWGYWHDVAFEEGFRLYQRDGEAVYAFPTSDGQVLVGVNFAIDRFKERRREADASYFDALARIAPDLHGAVRAGKTSERFRLGSTRSFFRTPCGPGWVLIGDAGYKKDPCTAQGITDAFFDADRLADVLDRILSAAEPEAPALARFHRERDEWARPFYELTCDLARMAPPPPEMQPLLAALQNRPEDAGRFAGMITTAVSPAEFLAPENVQRILAGA